MPNASFGRAVVCIVVRRGKSNGPRRSQRTRRTAPAALGFARKRPGSFGNGLGTPGAARGRSIQYPGSSRRPPNAESSPPCPPWWRVCMPVQCSTPFCVCAPSASSARPPEGQKSIQPKRVRAQKMLMSRGSRREMRRKIFGKGAENGARLGGLTPCITHCHIAPAHAFLSSPKGFTARGVARRRAARGGARGADRDRRPAAADRGAARRPVP